MPPPRVYMQVSRSGQMRRPWSQMSSPTLTTAVTSTSGSSRTPSRKRAPPTPPTSTVTFTFAAYVASHGPVVARREAGPEPGTAEARRLDVAHGPLPLRRVRGEHLGEPDVVERAAEQRPADDGGDVEVAEAHSVDVAPRALGHLGRRPHADAGHVPQQRPALAAPKLDRPLQPVGHQRGGQDRAAPGVVDARLVPLPVGHLADLRGRGRHAHAVRRGAGRGVAVAPHELAPRPPRLRAGDLLLEHG